MKFAEILELTEFQTELFFTRESWKEGEWITFSDDLNGMDSFYFMKHYSDDTYGVWFPYPEDLIAKDWKEFDWSQ